jgi:hypothetical protein
MKNCKNCDHQENWNKLHQVDFRSPLCENCKKPKEIIISDKDWATQYLDFYTKNLICINCKSPPRKTLNIVERKQYKQCNKCKKPWNELFSDKDWKALLDNEHAERYAICANCNYNNNYAGLEAPNNYKYKNCIKCKKPWKIKMNNKEFLIYFSSLPKQEQERQELEHRKQNQFDYEQNRYLFICLTITGAVVVLAGYLLWIGFSILFKDIIDSGLSFFLILFSILIMFSYVYLASQIGSGISRAIHKK